ncbi:MAG: hypothetical protein K0V04_36400 [Deltaproteobacteria bacterium]|nr:hypothetical protein [Deltaproteobacteria bacterium]
MRTTPVFAILLSIACACAIDDAEQVDLEPRSAVTTPHGSPDCDCPDCESNNCWATEEQTLGISINAERTDAIVDAGGSAYLRADLGWDYGLVFPFTVPESVGRHLRLFDLQDGSITLPKGEDIPVASLEEWELDELAEILHSRPDATVITPGIADLPLTRVNSVAAL